MRINLISKEKLELSTGGSEVLFYSNDGLKLSHGSFSLSKSNDKLKTFSINFVDIFFKGSELSFKLDRESKLFYSISPLLQNVFPFDSYQDVGEVSVAQKEQLWKIFSEIFYETIESNDNVALSLFGKLEGIARSAFQKGRKNAQENFQAIFLRLPHERKEETKELVRMKKEICVVCTTDEINPNFEQTEPEWGFDQFDNFEIYRDYDSKKELETIQGSIIYPDFKINVTIHRSSPEFDIVRELNTDIDISNYCQLLVIRQWAKDGTLQEQILNSVETLKNNCFIHGQNSLKREVNDFLTIK